MATRRQHWSIAWKTLAARVTGRRLRDGGEADAGPDDVAKLAGLFRVLADPATIPLLEFIAVRRRTAGECAAHLGLTCGGIGPRLAVLEERGWIRRGHGRYVLADRRVTEFIRLAQSHVANNAGALMQCQHLDLRAPRG